MRRLWAIIGIASVFVLAACQKEAALTYKLDFNVQDTLSRDELSEAAIRVIDRRMESMGEELVDHEILQENNEYRIKIVLSDAVAAQILTDRLQQPLKFRIMEEAPEAEADVVIAGHGGFRETDIDDLSINGVNATADDAGKGVIVMNFTPLGRQQLANVFQRNKGKYLGLFIRDRLASKLLVETDTLLDSIVIRDLPSPEIAQVFADDLNVGLHVTFSPIP